jgi:hypothetical protein
LAGWIAECNALACLEILTDLAANEYHGPARHNRLAQVVIEFLLGIGVLRVEPAQPFVGGHPGSSSLKATAAGSSGFRAETSPWVEKVEYQSFRAAERTPF